MSNLVIDQSERAGNKGGDEAPRVSTALLQNVPVQLEVFVGSARMTVAELAALRSDSVVPLDVPLNQAVELRLNSLPIARGELVAVGDKFGVRISEIVQWPE